MKLARYYQDLGAAGFTQEALFFAKAIAPGGGTHTGWPINREAWFRQQGLKYSTGEFEMPLHITSTPQSEPIFPATFACPPACMIFTAEADEGTPAFVYQPTVHVMGGTITAHVGATNATYSVKNLDGVLIKSGLVPLWRWPGVNYQPLADGTFVLLMCSDADTLHLIAVETPVFAPCPGPTPASSPRAMSWFGV